MQDGFSEAARQFYEWLTIELAPTICGSKPSTILSLVDTPFQALFTQWQIYGLEFLRQEKVRFLVLRQTKQRHTVLFYRPDVLEKCLKDDEHRFFLESLGYPVEAGIHACLNLLKERFQYACPHELGLLLGIPLKDVLGFMGMSSLPLTCRKEWCVYGNPDESLARMERFMQDRCEVAAFLAAGISCYEILSGVVVQPQRNLAVSVA
ncbi:MAG: DUF3793 family protein [Sporomusaceae bacterium]|nr:DUF3793 family protein [Sporomusaceae bacterium]